jgi:cell division protein FtsB
MKKKLNLGRLFIALFMIYSCYALITQQLTINNIKAQSESEKQQFLKLKEKNQKLQDEVKMSKTDMYIEKLARERLELIKEGEIPVINNK